MIKKIVMPLALTALAPILTPTQAYGQGDNALDTVVVTGVYSPQPALTSTTSVLEAAQIRALNKRNIADVLKTVPGLLVEEQGGPGGLTSISIRGAESNFTLVLLDGVQVNDPTNFRGGSFDFTNLNSSLIERIEVVRGAQSAVYGSDALAGVINIVTRRPTQGHQQEVFTEIGEDNYSHIGISVLGRLGELEYTLEVDSRDDGVAVEGSTREKDSANVRLGWQISESQHLIASYRYLDGERSSYPEQSGGPDYAVIDTLDESDFQDKVIALGWESQFTEHWRSSISVSRFIHEEQYTSPGIVPFLEVPHNAADTEFDRNQVQWVNTVLFGGGFQLDMGVDYRSEEGESVGYLEYFGFQVPTDFNLDRNTTGLFTSVSARPVDGLLLQGSARYDDPDEFDSEKSLGIGASYDMGQGFTLAANWGEAFKLPSFFALGHPLVGNPGLEPETAASWDLGLTWNSGETLRLEATYFANDYEDLVDFDDETFRNINRKNVETSGVELQGLWQVLPQLSFRAQLTYTDIDVKGENTVLTGRPEWTGGAVAEWRFRENWDTSLDYRYTGEQWAASRHTGKEVTVELDDFHRLDWTLRWQTATAWQLILSADNLLDERYETAVGFSAPGRGLRLGLRFSH